MAREKALVTPSVLRWARETAGFDLPTAAEKLKREVSELESWETGSDAPTIPQARALAALYRRGLAVFFLPETPKDDRPPVLPDFRRLPEDMPRSFSPQLRLIIRLTQLRLEWIRDELKDERAKPLPWVASAKSERNVSKLARTIRDWLGWDFAKIKRLRSNAEALRFWIDQVEERGAFVFQSGGPPSARVDLVEARGFALLDEVAPFVMINGADSEAGRIFTLIHEIVHLWIGAPGVSNLEPLNRPKTADQRLERFCNGVTAAVLVPRDSLLAEWSDSENTDVRNQISHIAQQFKVSREVIARRAAEVHFIDIDLYRVLRREYIAEWRRHQGKPPHGPKWSLMVPKRAGYALTRRALHAFAEGRISGSYLSELLNSKITRISEIAEHAGVPWRGWGSSP